MIWFSWQIKQFIDERLKLEQAILSFSFIGECSDDLKRGLENFNYCNHSGKVHRFRNNKAFTIVLKKDTHGKKRQLPTNLVSV